MRFESTYVYSKVQVHKSTGILKALYCADATLTYTLCPGYVNLALIETVKDFMAVNHNVAVALLRLSNNRHSLYLLYQYNYIIEGTHTDAALAACSIDDAADIWQNAHRQDHVVIERANLISWNPQKRHRSAVAETGETSAKPTPLFSSSE